MNYFGKPWVRFSTTLTLVLAVWCAGGFAFHRFLIHQNNSNQLEETAQDLLRRTEKAVDFAVIAGTELLVSGLTACNAQTQNALRRLVLNTGNTTNVFLITPNSSCSGIAELGMKLPSMEERLTWTEAQNPKYRIGPVDVAGTTLIGVSWGLGSDLEIVSFINSGAILFDALPGDIRSQGRVDLLLNSDVIASFSGDQIRSTDEATWVTFASGGQRYPLSITMQVDAVEFASWRSDIPASLAGVWGILGLLAATYAAFAAIRGYNHALADVVRALTNQEISAHFQSIVDVQSGSIIGCEALARWTKPNGDVVSPGRFIPLIEQYNFNDDLLAIMVERAATGLRELLDEHAAFYVSFNVTPDQLSRPDFADLLTNLARKHVLAPSQICIEITERQIIASPVDAAQTTEKLSAAGFRVAIDDAGTGHNGLAAIQQLDVGTVKIDKFFIDHIDEDPRSRVMVDMFVSVAKRYKMRTVAEGVETGEQLNALRAAGVDAIQGFYFSEPVCAEVFVAEFKEASEKAPKAKPVSLVPLGADEKAHTQPAPQENEHNDRATHSSDLETVDEIARLEALYRYQILDSAEEEAFERIPRIIKNALNSSMAAIALIDKDRRWFKAVAGGKRGEIPRQKSFCNHTIQKSEPTIVPDTRSDDVFRENALVINAPHIRAYLGVPLETSEGHRIGSVCCVDTRPREFSESEVQLVKDLTSIVMEQLEMRAVAYFDPLTSARSRASFQSEANVRLKVAQLQGQSFSVLMLDIDHFKQINDGYGHKTGDEVLRELGQRVSSLLGTDHIFGRIGGEEFAVALVGADLDAAMELAERVRRAVNDVPFHTSRGALPVTLSVGAASADVLSETLDDILEQADWALYQAKGQGRNCVVSATSNAA